MKSERINLLVTPDEKAFIDERARRAGISTSELVRRAVIVYDPDVDMEQLRVLSEQLASIIDQTEKKLDENLAAVARLRTELADKDALKAAVLAELKAGRQTWPYDRPVRRTAAEVAKV